MSAHGTTGEMWSCAHCGVQVEDLGNPGSAQHWVHVPTGGQRCYPQRGAGSSVAEPGDGWCEVTFQGGARCAKPAGHRPPGSQDVHTAKRNPPAPVGPTWADAARAHREGRLEALREVRNAAIALNRDPSRDPYLWGHGANEIIRIIDSLFHQAREAVQQQQRQQQKEGNGS